MTYETEGREQDCDSCVPRSFLNLVHVWLPNRCVVADVKNLKDVAVLEDGNRVPPGDDVPTLVDLRKRFPART